MGNCCGSLKVTTTRKSSLRSYRVAPVENGVSKLQQLAPAPGVETYELYSHVKSCANLLI